MDFTLVESKKKLNFKMQNEKKLDELGAAGRLNWSERYTWGHIVVQYEQLFSQLVNRKV